MKPKNIPNSTGWYFAKLFSGEIIILEVIFYEDNLFVIGIDKEIVEISKANWHTYKDEAIYEWGPKIEMWNDT